MLEKPALTSTPIADLIARRWSPRAIDRDQPVSREQLLALLEAARWAPSCFGDQPWRYLVWDRFHDATIRITGKFTGPNFLHVSSGYPFQHHHELIAAQTGYHVAFADTGRQPFGDLLQQQVAVVMT